MKAQRPLLTVLLAIAAPVHAAREVGVNFNNGNVSGAQAGFATQGATWTDVSGTTGSVSVQGAGFSAEWATSIFFQAGSSNDGDGDASQPADREISLYRRYLDDGDTPAGDVPADLGVAGDGLGVAVRLSGLAAWLAAEGAQGYRVTVYLSTDTDPATFHTISLRAGATLSSPVLDTITPARLGGGTFPSATGNITAGSRGFAQFNGFFTQDTIMLTVPSRAGPVRGTVAAVRISAVNRAIEVVDAGGGVGTTLGGDTLYYSIGQGHPVGAFVSASGQLLAGFQNLYVQHPARDTDGDMVIDENDADDDDDALGDWVELAGSSFNPVTTSDPLDADSDDDGASDRSESAGGTNPLDATMRLRIVSVVKAPGSNQATLTVQGRAGVPLKLQAAGSVAGLADVGDVTLTGGVAPWFFTTTTATEIHGAEAYRVYRLRVGP